MPQIMPMLSSRLRRVSDEVVEGEIGGDVEEDMGGVKRAGGKGGGDVREKD